MSDSFLTLRRSFGYDLYSLIGWEMSKDALLLSALADKELPWAQVSLACHAGCETAAKVALALRTFSESTGIKINRKIDSIDNAGSIELYDFVGCLVHHQSIEITIEPPLQKRCAPVDWIEIAKQSRHRLENIFVKSDKKTLSTGLSSFASGVADEINAQINSPGGRKLKENSLVHPR